MSSLTRTRSAKTAGMLIFVTLATIGVMLGGASAAQATGAADYSAATYYPANPANYQASNRPTTYPINRIIIHTTEGGYSDELNWFQNSSAGASAHYVVSQQGAVAQAVKEHDIAWHAGNGAYDQTSIGIEHEGYSSQNGYTDSEYRSSAKLAAYLCTKYAIPMDRYHIIGHNEVPDPDNPGQYGGVGHHTDPGPYWDWTKYMSYVKYYAGSSSTSSYSQAVDNSDTARFWADGTYWGTSSYSSQKYGADYRYASPTTTSHPAYFKITTPTAANYAVYGRWPASSSYNDRVAFWINTSNGWVSKTVSQRVNGGQWVYLGTYPMKAADGWNVEIDSKSSGTGYIMADAVAIVRA